MMRRLVLSAYALLLLTGSLGLAAPAHDAPAALDDADPFVLASAVRDALSDLPGLVTVVPEPDAPVLHAAFADAVPTELDDRVLDLALPAGWSLEAHADSAPQRMRTPVDAVVDVEDLSERQRDGVPPLPEDAVGIGPGSPILMTIPGEGTFICTANFVFEDGSRVFLGAAGHCFLAEGARATHGSGADYDARGVVVEVCVDFCYFGGQLTGLLGDFRTLGQVAYARQTGGGGDIGNDFGVVEVPPVLHSLVRAEMPMWEGPTGLDGNEGTGSPVVHYGNGIDSGTFVASKGRAGLSLSDGDARSWQALVSINGGDSGSAINHAGPSAGADGIVGTDALGLVTHGLVVGGVPIGWGTTIEQAVTMATQANLRLDVLLEGESLGGGGTPTFTDVHVASIDTAHEHYGNGGHRLLVTVAVVDDQGNAAPGVTVDVEVDAAGTTLTGSGSTDGSGTVTVSVQDKKAPHGTWDACVAGLSGVGYAYDASANAETCQAHAVN